MDKMVSENDGALGDGDGGDGGGDEDGGGGGDHDEVVFCSLWDLAAAGRA